MKNNSFLKVLCIFSLIVGALIGFIPLIPALVGWAFVILMFLVAPFVILYFKNLKLIKTIEIEKCLTIGAISGAVATLGFVIIYFPIGLLLHLIFKIQAFVWIKVLFVNIGYLIPMIFFTALVSALFNAFSAFLLAYFLSYFKKDKKQ